MLVPKWSHGIPEETVQVAQPAFPRGNKLMALRDALGPVFEDEAFAELYPSLGQPAESPGRLALVTVLQFMEQLTDREAADAGRGRIDWKYALRLELSDSGFHYSVLTEFRQRLIGHQATQLLLERILERCLEKGLLKGAKKQRTDSTRVLAAIRLMNRVELVGEAMRRALDELATVAPEWLLARMQPEWGERYSRKIDTYRIRRNQDKLQSLAKTIGQDGYALLRDVYAEPELVDIRTLPVIETLRRIWLQQYYVEADDIQWREKKSHGFPPARKMIASPDDQDARYGSKNGSTWTGYKVHLTETCERNAPRLVTHIETTVATSRDATVTETVQDDLIDRGLEPEVHLADGGYVDADNLISSQEKEIDLVGPVRPDSRWQSKVEGGYDVSRFKIDWEKKVAICPEGQSSSYWKRDKSAYGQPHEHLATGWSPVEIVDVDQGDLNSRAPALVFTSGGEVYATWLRSGAGMVYAQRTDGHWTTPRLLATGSAIGSRLCRMAYGTGEVHVLYEDDVNGAADVFHLNLLPRLDVKRYFAGGQQVAVRVQDKLHFILHDPTGTSLVMTDEAGNEVGHILYDGYGAVLTATLPVTLTGSLLKTFALETAARSTAGFLGQDIVTYTGFASIAFQASETSLDVNRAAIEAAGGVFERSVGNTRRLVTDGTRLSKFRFRTDIFGFKVALQDVDTLTSELASTGSLVQQGGWRVATSVDSLGIRVLREPRFAWTAARSVSFGTDTLTGFAFQYMEDAQNPYFNAED